MWTSERLDYSSLEYNKNDTREGCSEVIIGDRHLRPTFGRLDEDHELERLFSGFPGFHNSKVLKELLRGLSDKQKLRLLETVIRLLDRTFSSNLLPDQVKCQRAVFANRFAAVQGEEPCRVKHWRGKGGSGTRHGKYLLQGKSRGSRKRKRVCSAQGARVD